MRSSSLTRLPAVMRVLAAVRADQLASACADLAGLQGAPTVLFFGNDPDGRAAIPATVPGAVQLGFPGIGSGRGGAYTYDWIENLFGLNMHSATEILPEFQDLKVGDELPLGSGGPVMRAEVLDPPRALAMRTTDQNWAWIFALLPDGESTRLISRNRIATEALSPASRLFYLLVMEPGSLVMERKMLLGIKHRAEARAEPAGDLRVSPGPGEDGPPSGPGHGAGRPGRPRNR